MNKIMKDVDITEIFRELKKGNKTKMESNQILQDLIEKIEKRKEELEAMKVEESEKAEADGDNSSLPLEHADPVETSKPSLSSFPTQRRFSNSGTTKQDVFQSLGDFPPKTLNPGIAVSRVLSKESLHWDLAGNSASVIWDRCHAEHNASIAG